MRTKSFVFFLSVIAVVSSTVIGCQTQLPSPSVVITTATLPAGLTETPSGATETPILDQENPPSTTPLETSAQPDNLVNRIQYQINAELDYQSKTVEVDQVIFIPHPTDQPLEDLSLVVPPNDWANVFFLQEINWMDSPPLSDYVLDGVRLRINLPQSWQPGEHGKLHIRYRLELPRQNARQAYGPSPFGYTERQTNLVDWYPMVPPYQAGDGWIIHDPWIFGEYLVYPLADFKVEFQTGDPSLILAASSEAISEGGQHQYSLDEARNFVISISPEYQVFEEEIDGIRVYGYVFPLYLIPGQAAFQASLEALQLYSELFGSYDQGSLSMVQADFNHGMEYEGLFFLSKGFFDLYTGSQESWLVDIAVHETAHQWWYGQVANDQALEPWLDEGLCTYSEWVYYDSLYPESIDWWWATRVDYYQPSGVVDRSIYDFVEFTDQYLAYRNATYLQGAKFFDQLRKTLGDEMFFEFLSDYVQSYKGEIASQKDFFTLLENYLEVESLSWLGEYFSR